MRGDDVLRHDDLDDAIEAFRRAQEALVNGDAEPVKPLLSQRDDTTLANPLGPIQRGPADVQAATERAAAAFSGGLGVEYDEVSRYVTPELAYVVRVERTQTRVSGRDEVTPISLRVTMIYRREDDGWKVAHRHADPITSTRSADSLIET